MVALSGIAGPFWRVGVESPTNLQVLTIEIVGGDAGAGIVTATEDSAQVFTIEVTTGGEETVGTIGIIVAPSFELATLWKIINTADCASCLSLEAGYPFRTFVDKAATTCLYVHIVGPSRTTELLAWIVVGLVGLCVGMATMVRFGIAKDFTSTVNGTVGSADKELGTAIAIEVGHDEGRVMSTTTNVFAEVDSPHGSTIQTNGFEDGWIGEAAVAVVFGVGGIPFENDFQLTIAIKVGHSGIVGVVGYTLGRTLGNRN